MYDVTVTGLQRRMNPKPNKGGSVILAYFDCAAGGFHLVGCALVRTSKGGITAWPPKLDQQMVPPRDIKFADDALRHTVMEKAREAYRALGGTDAEWMTRPDEAERQC